MKIYCVDPVRGRQSINICTPANRPGEYEARRYFGRGRHMKIAQGQYAALDDLRAAIDERQYRQACRV